MTQTGALGFEWWFDLAVIAGAVFLLVEGIKRTGEWSKTEAGQRVLDWLPLVLGAAFGVIMLSAMKGVGKAAMYGIASGGMSKMVWQGARGIVRAWLDRAKKKASE